MVKVLPTFKGYTVDERLREFRKLGWGEATEFVRFDSPKGEQLLKEMREKGISSESVVPGKMADLSNMRKIIENDDLNPTFFIDEAKSLARELEGNANTNYVLEKLRHLQELNETYCRAKEGFGSSAVNSCVAELLKKSYPTLIIRRSELR